MEWRLLPLAGGDGAWNMAVDEVLLQNCVLSGETALRFYTWKSPTVTIGYTQRFTEAVNLEACEAEGVRVIRRLTGGRAVLHHLELTYSIVIPESHPLMPKSVTHSYAVIAGCFVEGLKQIGLQARATMPIQAFGYKNRRPSSCFETLSAHEINVSGRKLLGSAQVRKKGVILQHGSLLLDLNTDLYRAVFGENGLDSFTTLHKELGNAPSLSDLTEIFTASFTKMLGVKIMPRELEENEKEEAKVLEKDKYSQAGWNKKR